MAELKDKVYKYISKAIYNYNLIEEGDKIMLGVSGGKDSFVLLHDFARRLRKSPVKFEVLAVHVISDIATVHHAEELEELFKTLNIPYKIIFVGIRERLKEGRTLNCYWCAMQRRLEIFKMAYEGGFNKVAFAHHLDDVVETTLLNICFKGEISSMLPLMKYDKYPLSIIRPLYTVEERDVERLAEKLGFTDLSQRCALKDVSRRKVVKEVINTLSGGTSSVRKNILHAMSNINTTYLPRPQESSNE